MDTRLHLMKLRIVHPKELTLLSANLGAGGINWDVQEILGCNGHYKNKFKFVTNI